ncbi:DEAD/DEAH box helicase family protein [Agreia sp. PsM10]|uniref:DEAD/DEAH box helicase n=1 Tax=Agreia sp. PsM10 TaxID=3030533 RepID=UPI00263AF509|nr:type ISP restriction/modification enzyme [Agreia sp. PsM10]MDN4641118.1 DEAD/DEAH box helicase family protein [Agreia sp. PsM10]
MTTIHDLLTEYASIARDTREKGSLLERLTKTFLTTDPKWTQLFDEVSLWQEWSGRDGKTDTGIDLVARERHGGGYCAIQCKFYAPDHTIQKSDLDSFFTASGKNPFTSRIVVSTSTKWGKNAEDALNNQQIVTTRIGVDDFDLSDIDWSTYSFSKPDEVAPPTKKTLRPHQAEALAAVQAGFADSARGKLLMACGTGKTFTSLRIAEDIVGPGGSVLFLVPSIALLSQTLREWSQERNMDLRAFAICSDTKVGKSAEDFSVSDLAYPATTSTEQLMAEVARAETPDGLTVYFSTYQSIDVVARAQAEGLPEFDLVICDEAHRTAGFTRAGDEQSSFLRVHSDAVIHAKRRLYMTATPKIYADSVRAQADEKAAVLVSMDDEDTYGPIFHRLGFGEAVERDLLTDYRVLVLTIDEESVGSAFQQEFAQSGELNIPDAARIVGIYNGLAKRGVQGLDTTAPQAHTPLRRAVAFSRSIKESKLVTGLLDGYDGVDDARPDSIAGSRIDETENGEQTYRLESRHVDGTMNVLTRNEHLDWLKSDTSDENVCRILTNARCLSEGVDVPSLDAVIFLNSRDSPVDVVQSVGRVMRRSEGKDYGYIVLPIAIPAGQTPEQALNDNTKFKVVWDVLRALRAHDERFEAKIEQIDLNGRADDGPVIATNYTDAGLGEKALSDSTPSTPQSTQVSLDMSVLGAEWTNAIYAKIVDKVGDRGYWENWAANVADIAGRHQTRITDLVSGSDDDLRKEFSDFVQGLRDNLNPSITEDQAIEMLSQHLITQPVFDALFAGHAFSDHNPVSLVMQRMVDALEGNNLRTETADLEDFYAGVRRSVTGITDAAGKQTTIKRLYEKFFTGAFRNTSERLGIVYTPNEIVDFILRSADELSRDHFGVGLTDEGVHVLDPFTGTGTFIVRLLESGLIRSEDLARKFRYELHANEIVLLAYYVAAVNIEATYNGLAPAADYEPFPGIVLTDTFQSSEDDDRYDDQGIFGDNNQRVKDQNALDLRIIVGNPPYSFGQTSADDNNQNIGYLSLDRRIGESYAKRSTAALKNKLYDSYVRAVRWASDRIKDRGLVAFVINGGFLESNSFDGFRMSLIDEFTSIYVYNLRGNQRTAGEQSRREGGKVFGAGSRATIAILILVKDPQSSNGGVIHYHDIGDYLTREQKLESVASAGSISSISWQELTPNRSGDWLGPRSDTFLTFQPLATKATAGQGVIHQSVLGVVTSRDSWLYGSSKDSLLTCVSETIEFYNRQTAAISGSVSGVPESNPQKISWSAGLIAKARRNVTLEFDAANVIEATYRPFFKQYLYADPVLIERPGVLRALPPKVPLAVGLYVVGMSSAVPFSVLALESIPDLHVTGAGSGGQFFPRYTYELESTAPTLDIDLGDGTGGPTRQDNITPETLARYRKLYGAKVTADDVFFAVYGLLHSPDYRTEFAADLKKMLPRIPELADPADFWAFSAAGRALSELHLSYESVEPYPVTVTGAVTNDLYVTKMKFGGKPGAWDKTTVKVTDSITVTGIPEEAHEYMLGSRSAIEWVLDRYQVTTHKASGIKNDPNDWGREHGEPLYILDLLKRIVTVSVETVKIVNSLPPLRVAE